MKKYNSLYLLVLTLVLCVGSCSLFMTPIKPSVQVDSLSFSKSSLSLGIGSVEYLSLTIKPNEAKSGAKIVYEYDDSIITVSGDASGATVSGLKNGNTVLKAQIHGISTACVISVTGIDPTIENAPYISSSMPVVELEPGTNKKIMVSLSKGSSSEMALFNWSIDKSSIATIEPSGQNAIVTAKENGVARITVTHPSASYPYELLVFVKPENEKVVYLTTSQNIISLAHDSVERIISVSLINGTSAEQAVGFTWEILANSESDPTVVTLTANESNASISPKKEGKATIRVSHPKALYPLDIKVKVVTVVKNVYIDGPSSSTVNGTKSNTLKVSLKGTTTAANLDTSLFQWTIDDSTVCDYSAFNDEVILTGKKNGNTKLIVSHPAARYPKEILIVVENQAAGAIHSGAYITTSQNYIRTKVGEEDILLDIALVGGDPGDENNLIWTIDDPSVIGLRTTHGSVQSRSLIANKTFGKSYIEAKKEGMAVISIMHPKIASPTEVLVKVLPSYALLEQPLLINAQAILGLVKGTSQSLSVSLVGGSQSDEASLSWSSEDSSIVTVAGSGKEQLVTAVNNGQTFITVTHPKAEAKKQILCYVAETEEELALMKLFYTDKNTYNIVTPSFIDVYLSYRNISEEELATVQWASNNSSVATVNKGEMDHIGRITAVSSGIATVTATIPNIGSVKFYITVYPEGTNLDVLPPAIYFTTGQNVVQFSQLNSDKTVSVTPINLPEADYSQIQWLTDDSSVATVIQNGNRATITSVNPGTAKISVSHPKAENTLIITVRVGDEYIIVNPKDPFITSSQDVVGLVAGKPGTQITAQLINHTSNSGFTWEIDDSEIATISPLGESCFVIPKKPGQAQITISHAAAPIDKKVLVLVGNTEEELNGLAYLTTSQNVVRIKTNTQQTVLTKLVGIENSITTDYTWSLDNVHFAQVIPNGNHAVINGLQEGVARLTVSNIHCTYPLEITLIISDTVADASSNPYITSNQNIVTMTKGGSTKSLSVTLAGGKEEDNAHFTWSVDRGDLIQLTANGANAVIKGLKTGECRITVSHPKALYSFPIIVIVEDPPVNANLYINASESIVELKPASPSKTLTATLVGGVAEDKYGFVWSADNYNVIDLTYSANTAIISPRAEGKAEITISHPKAAFDTTLIVRVTEYSQFAFSQNSMTIPEGTTQFVSIQVPAMEGEYNGRVTYSTDNEQIVTITGTNKVAQITALKPGTAIVKATAPSGATSDLMVYVKKAEQMTAPYITSTTNVLAMKITDSQRSISASIVGEGITQPDQYNLKWNVEDPTVINLIGTSGTSVVVKPLKAGETAIKISHPKTDSIYTVFIQVEGNNSGVSLNKTYIALETGKTGELTASIDFGTSEDYANLTWSATKVNSDDIVSILGQGKTIAVYALKPGETDITVEHNGKTAKCSVLVSAARQFNFDIQRMTVHPGETKTFKYNVVPEESAITILTDTNDYITYALDTNSKTISITGIAEGITKLSGIANSMTASVTINCSWDYRFSLNKTQINAPPVYDPTDPGLYTISYDVNPSNATLQIDADSSLVSFTTDTVKKEIYIRPKKEGSGTISIKAINPATNKTFGTQTCNVNFSYSDYTVVPTIVSKNGRFSTYDKATNTLFMGDGEDVTLEFAIAEQNASASIASVVYTKTNTTLDLSGSSGRYKLKHPTDITVKEYVIHEAWMPVVYRNQTYTTTNPFDATTYSFSYSNPFPIVNWKTDMVWWTDADAWGSGYVTDYCGLASKTFSIRDIDVNNKEDLLLNNNNKWYFYKNDDDKKYYSNWWTKQKNPAEVGKIYTQAEFEAIPWYYCHGINWGTNQLVRYSKGVMTENVTATLRATTNTAIVKQEQSGYLTVTINTPSGSKSKTISVITNIRNCSAQ